MSGVFELDDSLPYPGPGLPFADDFGFYIERVPVKQRVRVFDHFIPQICDQGSLRQIGDREPGRQAQRKDSVDNALPELSVTGKFFIEVKRLRVHGKRAEEHVVHFGNCTRLRMFDNRANFQLVVESSRHGIPFPCVFS